MNQKLLENSKRAELFALEDVLLFEMGTVFESHDEEHYVLTLGIHTGKKKGKAGKIMGEALEGLSERLGIDVSKGFKGSQEGQHVVYTVRLDKHLLDVAVSKSYSEDGIEYAEDSRQFEQFSQYPFMLRDISMWVPADVVSGDVLELLKNESGELLVQHRLFDIFEKEGRVSYAFRLVYQSMGKTLSDEEVNKIMDKINTALQKKDGWEVR